MRDLQARLGFLVILHLPGNVKCTPSTALDDFFARHFADGRFWRTARSRPNENKMSDGGRGRASLGVKVWKSSQKWSVRRSAVRSIAWLGLCGLFDALSSISGDDFILTL